MNNDNNTTSSVVVGCSSITTTATGSVAGNTATTGCGGGGGGATTAGDSVNTNDSTKATSTSTNSTVAGHSTTTIGTTSPSIYTSASASKSSSAAAISSNTPGDDKADESESSELNINDWDYCRFKRLLEEAISYKNPCDKKNKSEAFLELLKTVETKEKEDQKFEFCASVSPCTTRSSTSNSQKQGGSLQDLGKAVRNESLDLDCNCGGSRNRHHNHNSRPKKYSSVSSRQREGGSLPSNVNVTNCNLSLYEPPFFINDDKSKEQTRRNKNEPRIVINRTITATCLPSATGISSSAGSGASVGGSACGSVAVVQPHQLGTTSGAGGSITNNPIKLTPTALLSGSSAEISLTTNACLAPSKSSLTGVGIAGGGLAGGCGGGCSEGTTSISVASLAASIGSTPSATCAALATATAVVSDSADTATDMSENYIDQHNDLLPQDAQFNRADRIEMKIPRANIIGSVLTRSDFSPNNTTCYVDEAVHFTTLERGKSTIDERYLPLDENYRACKSVLGEKSDLVKMQSFSATKTISKQYDENGNSLNTTYTTSQSQAKAKKKKPQSERNTKTLDVQSFEGYRGSDPIEELVKYIESSEDTTNSRQNDKVSKFADSNNKKKEKKKDKEKEKNKMKRCNSLEELRSCSKLDTGDDVTMRNKSGNIKNKNVIENKDSGATAVVMKQIATSGGGNAVGNNRKGERRSWGTEELTYLGENNAIEEVREKVKDKEKKKSKEKDKDVNEKVDKVNEKRKKSDANLVVSMESISCESAEFHVVTKKKKPKKQRQFTEENKNSNSANLQKNPMYQNRKYHSNFSNDHDAYLNTFNNNTTNDKSRRKSTSSMPPSEKSDSSDLDSVHSLPIESAGGGRSPLQIHHHHPNQPRSYADIARKTDTATGIVVTSPANNSTGSATALGANDSNISNTSSSNSSHTELEVNVTVVAPATTASTTKKSKKIVKTDFPELICYDGGGWTSCSSTTSSTSTVIKPISYSQSLISTAKTEGPITATESNATQKLMPPEINRTTEKHQHGQHQHQQQQQQMPLQKSKSVETDTFYNSIDQYPALEKTVKRHGTMNTSGGGPEPIVMANANTTVSGMISVQMTSNSSSITNPGCVNIVGTPASAMSKKSKTNTNTKAIEEVLTNEPQQQQQQQPSHPHQQHKVVLPKKSKKEKINESFAVSLSSAALLSSTTSYSASSINNNKNQINHNHHINNYNLTNNINKTSCSHSHNNSSNNSSSSNKFSNRPAVIILNDDTTAGSLSSCIGNEFTFGDFNEEELRLFDDNQPQQQQAPLAPQPPAQQRHQQHSAVVTVTQKPYTTAVISLNSNFDDSGGNFNSTVCSTSSEMANNSDDAMLLMHTHTSSPNTSLSVTDQLSSDSGICNNYEGTMKGKRKNQQITIIKANIAYRSASTDTANNNMINSKSSSNNIINSSSTSPSKESLSSASSSSSSSSSTSSTSSSSSTNLIENVPLQSQVNSSVTASYSQQQQVLVETVPPSKTSRSTTTPLSSPHYNQQQQQQQPQIQLVDSSKSNRITTMNKRNSQQQTSNTNCAATPIPNSLAPSQQQQQLETCDDIETAIIAAAKKAAAVAAEQTTASVINKNYATKHNSHLSSPMGSMPVAVPPLQQLQQQNNLNNNNANHFNSNSYINRQGIVSPPSYRENSSTTPAGKMSRDARRVGVVVTGTLSGGEVGFIAQQQQQPQQRKGIDVHFIPPSSIQNNETIINFIGSAWEEVANSKVTQFYDGQ